MPAEKRLTGFVPYLSVLWSGLSKFSTNIVRLLIAQGPLSNPLKFSGQIYWRSFAGKGSTPGVKTPLTPDEPDVLDAGDGVEGVGVYVWRRVRRVRRVGGLF